MEKLKTILGFHKNKRLTEALKAILVHMLCFLTGFIMSSVSFFGNTSPFATGFTAGVKSLYSLTAAVGSAIGYVVFFGFFNSLRFVCAVSLICLISLGLKDKVTGKYRMLFVCLTAFLSCFLSSLAVFIAVGGENTYIIMSFSEALIASAFAGFTEKLSDISTLRKKADFFDSADTVTVIFFGSVLLLSLDTFSFGSFSPARCIAYFIILLFSVTGKEAMSSIAGISSALTLGFSPEKPSLMMNFILSGLFSGVTGRYGKIPSAIALVISTTLSVVLKGDSETALFILSEAVLSSTVFVFIPEKRLISLARRIIPLSEEAFDEEKGKTMHFLLKRSAKAVRDISESVNAVSRLLQKTEKPPTEDFPLLVKEDICKECNKYDFCWKKCSSMTENAFNDAKNTLLEKGRLSSSMLPERITLICRMPEKLSDSFNRVYCEYNARLVAREEIFEAKKAAARQFYTLGSIIDDAAEKLCFVPRTDPVVTNAVSGIFNELGFTVGGISAFTSPEGRSTLRVYCTRVPVIPDISVLTDRLFDITGKCYLPPVADEYSDEGTVLSFTEEARLTAEYHTALSKCTGEEFSGDTCECFFDGSGFFYAVLSDGMGSGPRAAVDSVMTSSLMSRLMRAGFSPESALEAVNCALMIKSPEETLSTLDIVKIDLESGKTEFFKAGAAASVIKKGEKTLAVEKSSLPLGILRETLFEKSEITLSDGDIIFLMSDGASVIPLPEFRELIRDNKNGGVVTLSETALNKALDFSPAGKHDDITITCIKIKANK